MDEKHRLIWGGAIALIAAIAGAAFAHILDRPSEVKVDQIYYEDTVREIPKRFCENEKNNKITLPCYIIAVDLWNRSENEIRNAEVLIDFASIMDTPLDSKDEFSFKALWSLRSSDVTLEESTSLQKKLVLNRFPSKGLLRFSAIINKNMNNNRGSYDYYLSPPKVFSDNNHIDVVDWRNYKEESKDEKIFLIAQLILTIILLFLIIRQQIRKD